MEYFSTSTANVETNFRGTGWVSSGFRRHPVHARGVFTDAHEFREISSVDTRTRHGTRRRVSPASLTPLLLPQSVPRERETAILGDCTICKLLLAYMKLLPVYGDCDARFSSVRFAVDYFPPFCTYTRDSTRLYILTECSSEPTDSTTFFLKRIHRSPVPGRSIFQRLRQPPPSTTSRSSYGALLLSPRRFYRPLNYSPPPFRRTSRFMKGKLASKEATG